MINSIMNAILKGLAISVLASACYFVPQMAITLYDIHSDLESISDSLSMQHNRD